MMMSRVDVAFLWVAVLLLAGLHGAGAVLDDACGLPLLRAHYACQDIMTSTAAASARRTALRAASSLPDSASCCDALAVIFTPQWQTNCACRQDMADQTTAQDARLMKRFARSASAMCPASPDAPKPWAWSACSLGNATAPAGVPVAPAPNAFGPQAAAKTPARMAWEDLVAVAAGASAAEGRKLLQSCATGDYYDNLGGTFAYACNPGYGHCDGKTCTFGTGVCLYRPNQLGGCYGGYRCYRLFYCVSCFPGGASVTLESGERRAMSQLAVGDRVQVIDPASGKVSFEEVYLFGHQLPDVTATFVRASLSNGQVLTLSPDHFVPVVPVGKPVLFKNTVMVRGRDVVVGMHMFGAGSGAADTSASMVEHVALTAEKGLFNPYTMGGLIVVDGVVASAHSSWVFDGLMDALGLTHKIPALYQALFAPLRVLYRAVGAERMAVIAPAVADFGNALVEGNVRHMVGVLGQGVGAVLGSAAVAASGYAVFRMSAAAANKKAF